MAAGEKGSKENGTLRVTVVAEERLFVPAEGGRLSVPALIQIEGPEPGYCHKLTGVSSTYVIGREEGTDIRIVHETVSRKHARIYYRDSASGFVVRIKDLGSTNGILVNGERVEDAALKSGDKVLLGHVLLKFDMLDVKDLEYLEKITQRMKSAEIDPLTGLFTRRFLTDQIPALAEECARNHVALSVLMMDLDHFKAVNDRFGHPVGDAVLKRAGAIVRRSVREEDIAIRYGGEELLVVLPGTRLDLAEKIAERIWQAFHDERWSSVGDALTVTISIGLAERDVDEDFETLTRRADRALYEAKSQGRDRVVLATNA